MAWGKSQVSKSFKAVYPKDWNSITAKVSARDGDRCFQCGRTRAQLKALNKVDGKDRRLETHHLFSVRTGNNKKTNLCKLCSVCHAKQHKHGHLKK